MNEVLNGSNKNLHERVNMWTSIVTMISIVIPGIIAIFQMMTTTTDLEGCYELGFRPVSLKSPIVNTYQHDTLKLKELNSYLKEEIPLGYVDFYDSQKQEILPETERVKYQQASLSLSNLNRILSSPQMPNRIRDDANITVISITNTGETVLKDVKINLDRFKGEYFSPFLDNMPRDQYLIEGIDTIVNFEKMEDAPVGTLLPGQRKRIYIASITYPLDQNGILISYEGGNKIIYPVEHLVSTGKFDKTITELVIGSKIIQFILYVLTILGAIYFLFYLIPRMRRMFLFLSRRLTRKTGTKNLIKEDQEEKK